jgi:hypothetical protein
MIRNARVDLPTGVQAAVETFSLASGVTVQVCRTSVQAENGPSTLITLLLDERGLAMPTESDLANFLTQSPSPGIVAGLLSAQSGSASVATLPQFVNASEELALVAAVCSASWGWDESERIHVTVNGREWHVTPYFRDGAWMATIA